MRKSLVVLSLVLLWHCSPSPPPPPPPPPPPTTTTTTTPIDPPPPPPPVSRPQDYIQWTCHESKPRCTSRVAWGKSLDNAYAVWRGEQDLQYLHDHGQRFLKGGERELVDMTADQLVQVIAGMTEVNARGNRTIHRILTLQHRFFVADPLAPWHRSQVRKTVAKVMRDELEKETSEYAAIAVMFPQVVGCDSIRCKVRRLP